MSKVSFRRHQFSTMTNEHGIEVDPDSVTRDPEILVDVDIPSLINVNALVASARGATGFWARHHELRLILSLVTDRGPGQVLRLLGPEFTASSGHIRRFISESVGLGLLTGAPSERYGWRPSQTIVANFDVLPAHLQDYKTSGVRPDLLYALPGGYIAGEARGRSTKAPKSSSSKAQMNRLNDLLIWSEAFDKHPFFMSWSHITAERTVVDFFEHRLEDGPRDDPRHHGWTPQEGYEDSLPVTLDLRTPPTRVFQDEDPDTLYELPSDSERYAEHRRDQSTRRSADSTPPDFIANIVRERLSDGEQSLFDTAPAEDRQLLDRRVRGAWGHRDLLGPTGHYFFLGVLDRGFTEEEAAELSRPREPGRPIEAGVSGRLVAAVTHTASTSPPSMRTVEEALSTLA